MSDLVLPSDGARVPPLPPEAVNSAVRSEYDKTVNTWGIPNNLIRALGWHPGLALTEVDYANSFIFDDGSYTHWPRPGGTGPADTVLYPVSGFNIYSVGTPHEIILARTQRKPVLFVSPRVKFDTLGKLREHLRVRGDKDGLDYLKELENAVPITENPTGAPSLWYMPLVGAEHFFDGFGFEKYRKDFGWEEITDLEKREAVDPPAKPLLPFLLELNQELPKKWNRQRRRFDTNDDWLLWDLHRQAEGGGTVEYPRGQKA